MEPGAQGIAIGAGLFLLGLALGVIVARASDAARRRARELEEQLRQSREQQAAYEDSVAKHFSRTADLVRDLTHQYASLYAHLAEGSRELCADRLPALGRGFEAPLLAGAMAAPPEDGRVPDASPLAREAPLRD
jgi:hypothetical protein